MVYYSVFRGLIPGIYSNWKECEKNIKGFKGAKFKKFNSLDKAKYFLKNGIEQLEDKSIKLDKFIINNQDKNENIQKVYTDGSCYGNGQEISFGGYGIYFGENDKRNVSKPLINLTATNNIAELTAILEVFEILRDDIINGDIIQIITDSEYSIKAFTTYGQKCHNNLWKKNIPNKD